MPKRKSSKSKKSRSSKAKMDWIHADVDRLSPSQIAAGLKSMKQTVSRSISRLDKYEKDGMTSPAIQFLNETGGMITTPQDIEARKDEFVRAQSYLKIPEHTVKGYQSWLVDVGSVMKTVFRTYGELTEDEQEDRKKMYWRAFNRMKQAYPWVVAEPHRATDIIDATKEEMLENMELQSIDDMYEHIMKYMEDEVDQLPSSVASSWTFARPESYETDELDVVENTYIYQYERRDERRKK